MTHDLLEQARRQLAAASGVVTCRYVLIDKPLADSWLAKSVTQNRHLRAKKLKTYVADLKAGRFRFNGESIVIGRNGSILDGHHRLTAVSRTGIAIVSVVVEGIDPAAFDTIDTGSNRTGGDALTIKGVPNANAVAAIARMVWLNDAGLLEHVGTGALVFTNHDLTDVLAAHPGVMNAAVAGISMHRRFPAISGKLFGFGQYTFAKYNAAAADEFLEDVAGGRDLREGSAALLLRDRMTRLALQKATMPQVETVALFVKAWRMHVGGQTMTAKGFRWRSGGGEPFPSCNPAE